MTTRASKERRLATLGPMSTRSGRGPASGEKAQTVRDGDEPERLRRARELHRRQRAYVLESILTVGRVEREPPARPAPRA
jgi:hypothetical protein